MKLLSKQLGVLFFVVGLVMAPVHFVAAETLEVVLLFPSPVVRVNLDGIRIVGAPAARATIDSVGALHIYQSPHTTLPQDVTVILAKSALYFQDGTQSEALVKEVPLQQRTYAAHEMGDSTPSSAAPSAISTLRSALSGLLLPFVAFNPDIFGYVRNLPTYLGALLAWILSAFGLRKHKKLPWGTVYNAITKDPIPFAIVRLVEGLSGKVRETQVTDYEGRFGFVPPRGLYRLEVTKAGFHYPSVIVQGTKDGNRNPLYHRELTSIQGDRDSIISYIPLDPTPAVQKKASLVKRVWALFQGAIQKSAAVFFILGVVSSVMLVFALPTITHMILLGVYALMALVQLTLVPQLPRPWGTVVNAQNAQPVPLASVTLIETKYDRVVKCALPTLMDDFIFYQARDIIDFGCGTGVSFPAQEQVLTTHGRKSYTGEVFTLGEDDAVVNMDVPVDQLKKG